MLQMSEIMDMERGKVCKMQGRPNFNHQTWQEGRNVVRYIHSKDVQDLEKAIKGYTRFMLLVQRYADEIIRLSRNDRKLKSKKRHLSKE